MPKVKTLFKLAVAGGVLVAVLAIIGIWMLYKNRNPLLRRGTEEALTYALQVPCAVGGADLEPAAGTVELRDISIGNPEGFHASQAMKFGLIRAEVNLASFRSGTPEINVIEIGKINISLEAHPDGSNLSQLMKNADRLSNQGNAAPAPAQPAAGRSMVVREVRLAGSSVSLQAPLAKIPAVTIPLPDLTLHDLGGAKQSTTPAEALRDLLAALLASVRNVAAKLAPDQMIAALNTSLGGVEGLMSKGLGDVTSHLGNAAGGVGNQVKELAGETTQGVKGIAGEAGQAAGKLKQGLGGLFGSKDSKAK